MGLCHSHCPEHSWVVSRYSPSKKSIFNMDGESQDNSTLESQDNSTLESQRDHPDSQCDQPADDESDLATPDVIEETAKNGQRSSLIVSSLPDLTAKENLETPDENSNVVTQVNLETRASCDNERGESIDPDVNHNYIRSLQLTPSTKQNGKFKNLYRLFKYFKQKQRLGTFDAEDAKKATAMLSFVRGELASSARVERFIQVLSEVDCHLCPSGWHQGCPPGCQQPEKGCNSCAPGSSCWMSSDKAEKKIQKDLNQAQGQYQERQLVPFQNNRKSTSNQSENLSSNEHVKIDNLTNQNSDIILVKNINQDLSMLQECLETITDENVLESVQNNKLELTEIAVLGAGVQNSCVVRTGVNQVTEETNEAIQFYRRLDFVLHQVLSQHQQATVNIRVHKILFINFLPVYPELWDVADWAGHDDNVNNNSSRELCLSDQDIEEQTFRIGDHELLSIVPDIKSKSSLPPLLTLKKKVQMTKHHVMRKLLQSENLPVLPSSGVVKDMINTGDNETGPAAMTSVEYQKMLFDKSRCSRHEEDSETSTLGLNPRPQSDSDLSTGGLNIRSCYKDPSGDFSGAANENQQEKVEAVVEECPVKENPWKLRGAGEKYGIRSKVAYKKGARCESERAFSVDQISEVSVGHPGAHSFPRGLDYRARARAHRDTSIDEEDSDSESETESEEDEEEEAAESVNVVSEQFMSPWCLQKSTRLMDSEEMKQLDDFLLACDDLEERKVTARSPAPTVVSTALMKRLRLHANIGGGGVHAKKAVGSGSAGKGKGESNEAGGARGGGSGGKKEKGGEHGEGGGDDFFGKGSDDSSGGGGGGKRGNKTSKPSPCALPANMQPTFYVSGGNNSILVEGPLLELGWKKTTDKHDERYRLKWVENRCRINYIAFREGEQLVNHIPNCKLLTNKLGLLCSLQEYERVTLLTKGRLPRLKMVDFVPETFKLDERTDRDRFLSEYKDGETWICKPTSLNQGKGIFLLRSRDEINQLLSERDAKSSWTRQVQMRIVQRYIHNPLLIEGRKFDIRAYMFIASTVPFLVLFHNGYVRLSCQKYNQDDTNLTTHLTNQFVQKKDPTYKDNKEDTAWTMDKLNDYVNETVAKDRNIEKDWVFGGLTKQMQRITLHCFNSVKHKLQCKVGYFDLYGMDFMVDADLKVWLIEINANPALWTNCQALKEAIPCVVRDALYLAIECFDKSRKGQPLMPLNSLGGYNVLYCGSHASGSQRQIRSVSPFKDAVDMGRPTGNSPTPGIRRQSPPRVVNKLNSGQTYGSPYASASDTTQSISKTEKKSVVSTTLPTINTGANVNSHVQRPVPVGGASSSKKHATLQHLPQQNPSQMQISRVSLVASTPGEDHKLRMTHAYSGVKRVKEHTERGN
ncbi:uncharacterized protein LOC131952088 isoform X3 [Physella acuta]|nr:uncharacterized protein LOC131952088 isoform X3 [Physella acuta]